jgi:hypothetical protein
VLAPKISDGLAKVIAPRYHHFIAHVYARNGDKQLLIVPDGACNYNAADIIFFGNF